MNLPLNQVIHGDCLEFMKTLPDKCVDLVLTDPPYGIGEDGGRFRDRKGGGHRVLPKGNWDKERPSKEYFDEIFRVSKNQIIFGGNYFTDYLYPSRGWIYWGKKMGGDFSDGELAWTSFDKVLKEFQFCNKYKGKQHPTEKPVPLFAWILNRYSEPNSIIFDPFAGSGTTALACKELLNRNYILVEKEKNYIDIINTRIQSYSNSLFN
jgi:site-specific DNA-methyltransferase (adenine-specific)